MDYDDWGPYYAKILEQFGYSRAEDERAARILSDRLGGVRAGPADLNQLLRGQAVTVAGNAAALEGELGRISGVVLAADEATSVLATHEIHPDAIVTDLDGLVEDQIRANRKGAIAVVHAHGDNIPAIERWAPRFEGPTVATTQAEPFEGVHNFGGFTDGDRAVLLAAHFGARSIRLVGFDFTRPNRKDVPAEVKQRKLEWAYILIHSVAGKLLEG